MIFLDDFGHLDSLLGKPWVHLFFGNTPRLPPGGPLWAGLRGQKRPKRWNIWHVRAQKQSFLPRVEGDSLPHWAIPACEEPTPGPPDLKLKHAEAISFIFVYEILSALWVSATFEIYVTFFNCFMFDPPSSSPFAWPLPLMNWKLVFQHSLKIHQGATRVLGALHYDANPPSQWPSALSDHAPKSPLGMTWHLPRYLHDCAIWNYISPIENTYKCHCLQSLPSYCHWSRLICV